MRRVYLAKGPWFSYALFMSLPHTTLLMASLALSACWNQSNPLDEDQDGDGFTEFDGDCDDENADLSPEDEDEDGFDFPMLQTTLLLTVRLRD